MTKYESNIARRTDMLCKHCWRPPSMHGPNGECLDEEPPFVLEGEAAEYALEILRRRGKL